MNYGYIDKKHILEKAEKICDCIGHGLYGTAVEMIVETAVAETGLGQITDRTVGDVFDVEIEFDVFNI